jgi:hypothetical protein
MRGVGARGDHQLLAIADRLGLDSERVAQEPLTDVGANA